MLATQSLSITVSDVTLTGSGGDAGGDAGGVPDAGGAGAVFGMPFSFAALAFSRARRRKCCILESPGISV